MDLMVQQDLFGEPPKQKKIIKYKNILLILKMF